MKRALALCFLLAPLAAAAQSSTPAAAPSPEPSAAPSPEPTATQPSFQSTGDLLRDTWNNSVGRVVDAMDAPLDEISEEDERALGQATALEIVAEGGGLLVSDTELVRYVNRVGNLVAQQGSRQVNGPDGKPRSRSRDFVFGVLDDDDTINAYSTPGGYVFVTSGLVRSLGSESELAWVLGHEISHVDLEHGLGALKAYMRERSVAISFAEVTGDLNARQRWQNGAFFKKLAGMSADVSRQLYGKDEERAADKLGLEYAVKAGYDPWGASRVLQTMQGFSQRTTSLFATHDPPEARRQEIAPRIAELAKQKGASRKLGMARFTRECIDRLDAIRAAHPAQPTPPPAPAKR
ncbi:MAG TPA: M48 family metalloprotease [bacterium]|nr:M48 family metalloprotease [bacterium]